MFQVKLKSFKTLQVSAILSCLLLLLFSPVTFAETEQRCDVYVKSSLQQNKENVTQGCGFTGGRWNNNASGQKNWCLGVGEHILSSETAERSSLLASCKSSNVKKGKPRAEAKDKCHPSSLQQLKASDPKALYGCLQGSKQKLQGNKDGYSYRSYLHAFGKDYYLLNFINRANKVSLKIYEIGNSGINCPDSQWRNAQSDPIDQCKRIPSTYNTCSFDLSGKNGEILVAEHCSETGDRYSTSTTRGSFILSEGQWKPTRYTHNSSGGDIDGFSNVFKSIIDLRRKKYCVVSINSTIRVGFSDSNMVEAGDIINQNSNLTIDDFYPKSKKLLAFRDGLSKNQRNTRAEKLKLCDQIAK